MRDGKTHRAYLWSYCTTRYNETQAVVFDFAERRGGQHVRNFLGLPGTEQSPGWKGKLVTDDFSGYKACFEMGVTESPRESWRLFGLSQAATMVAPD